MIYVVNLNIMTFFIETVFQLKTCMISLNHVKYLNNAIKHVRTAEIA